MTQVSKYHVRYSQEFKHQVCQEYLKGGLKQHIEKKHGFGKGRVIVWLRELNYLQQEPSNFAGVILPNTTDDNRSESDLDVKALKRELEAVKLELEAHKLIIEIAEKEFKIPIRKKPDTK